MNKNLLFIVLVLSCFISFAQFEVRNTTTDELITDGQVINFNESGASFGADYNWKFKVTNTSTSDIYMRIFVENMANNDGSSFQLCFAGICLNSITLNSGYPTNAALIESGATNSVGNSLWNQNPAGTPTAMSWTFRFQAFDAVGGSEIGTPFFITYNYDQNLTVDESEHTNVNIYPTSVKDELNVSTDENLSAEFYDLSGRKVKQVLINSGKVKVNISDLASQLYFIRFTNDDGSQTIKKIIKK